MVSVFTRRCPHQRILRELEHCELCLEAERPAAVQARTVKTNVEPLFQPGDEVVMEGRVLNLARAREMLIAAARAELQRHGVATFSHGFERGWYVFRDRTGFAVAAFPDQLVESVASQIGQVEALGHTNFRIARLDLSGGAVELGWTEPGPALC